MSNIFIVGVTGGVGLRLASKLISAGHKVTGLHRKPEQAVALSEMGVMPVQGDLMKLSSTDLADYISGHDIIIFTAGAAGRVGVSALRQLTVIVLEN